MTQQYRFTRPDGAVSYEFIEPGLPDLAGRLRRLMQKHGASKAEPVDWVCPVPSQKGE